MLFLICISLILTVACTIREYCLSQETTDVTIAQDNNYSHLHKTIDNSELSWNFILINRWNCLPENFGITLRETENGEKV